MTRRSMLNAGLGGKSPVPNKSRAASIRPRNYFSCRVSYERLSALLNTILVGTKSGPSIGGSTISAVDS